MNAFAAQSEEREELDSPIARAERAEAMYQALVQQLPAVTYAESIDDARTISVSPQVEELFGYTQQEWMANELLWMELIHPDDRDRVVDSCRVANEREEPWQEEYRMIARDGRIVWVRDAAVLVRGTNGNPLCWQGVMIDITAQKLAG